MNIKGERSSAIAKGTCGLTGKGSSIKLSTNRGQNLNESKLKHIRGSLD